MALVPPHLAHSCKDKIEAAKNTARILSTLCFLGHEIVPIGILKWQLTWGKPRNYVLHLISVPCDMLHPKQTGSNLPEGQGSLGWSALPMVVRSFWLYLTVLFGLCDRVRGVQQVIKHLIVVVWV